MYNSRIKSAGKSSRSLTCPPTFVGRSRLRSAKAEALAEVDTQPATRL
ncbi:MAG: hypothetical protein AAB445_02640 [Patescibacteria group bacterium]